MKIYLIQHITFNIYRYDAMNKFFSLVVKQWYKQGYTWELFPYHKNRKSEQIPRAVKCDFYIKTATLTLKALNFFKITLKTKGFFNLKPS